VTRGKRKDRVFPVLKEARQEIYGLKKGGADGGRVKVYKNSVELKGGLIWPGYRKRSQSREVGTIVRERTEKMSTMGARGSCICKANLSKQSLTIALVVNRERFKFS